MSKEMWVIVLGIWTVVVPYLGIPGSWKVVLFVLTGLAIAVVGFLLRGEALSRTNNSQSRPFVDKAPAPRNDTGITSLN